MNPNPMKTITTTKLLLPFLLLLSFAFKMNAQCVANFTYAVNHSTKTVTFTNTSTGGSNVQYSWTYDGGLPLSNTTNPVFTFQNPGWHYVCLKAINLLNNPPCDNTKCDSVFISGTAPCKAEWFNYGDTNGMMWYNASQSTGANLIYRWNFDDGSQVNNIASPFTGHQFHRKGIHNVCLTVINLLDTSCHDTKCKIISNRNICDAEYNFYFDSLSNPYTYHFQPRYSVPNTAYLWDFGDGTTSSSQLPAHQFSTPGPHKVCLTVSNTFDSCSATSCDSIPNNIISGIREGTLIRRNSFSIHPNPVGSEMYITIDGAGLENIELVIFNAMGQKVIEHSFKEINGSKTIKVNTEVLSEGIYMAEIRKANVSEIRKFIK